MKKLKCKKCGSDLNPLMGREWDSRVCQNCYELEKMRDDLARQGLCPLDLM